MTSRFHRGLGLALAVLFSAPCAAFAAGVSPLVFDTGATFDVNEIKCYISNFGTLARDYSGADIGMEWPQGSGQRVIHAAGLWLLDNNFGDVHSAMADYGSEYTPGQLDFSGDATDPFGSNRTYHVYKISRDDLLHPGSDYLNWPTGQGAPVDAEGNPRLIGDQTLYCTFNDSWPDAHDLQDGSAKPMKAEVHETVFGYNRQVPLTRMMFVQYEIRNHTIFRWPETYVGIWLDPDLGARFDDDYAATDSSLGAAYAYDTENYGAPSPAVGAIVLEDTLLGHASPGVLSASAWTTRDDPVSFGSAQNLLRGRNALGVPWQCATFTKFPYQGDPVAGTGCLDSLAGDQRLMISTGPYDVPANGLIRFVVAFVVGYKDGALSVKDNITALREGFAAAQAAWRDSFSEALPIPTQASLSSAFSNPSTGLGPSLLDFAVPAGVKTEEIQVFDMHGRMIWREPAPPAHQGYLRLHWEGQTLGGPLVPPGVYFFRLLTDQGPFTQKIVRLR
jgi:hypothetical protein